MKRLVVAAFVVLSVVVATQVPNAPVGHAQEGFDPFGGAPAANKGTPAKAQPGADEQPKNDNLEKLRAQLVTLTKARSELMTEGELQREIEMAKNLQVNAQARQELKKARETLQEILLKYPNTPAAEAAREAGSKLEIIRSIEYRAVMVERRFSSGSGATKLTPQPDRAFREPSRKRRSAPQEPGPSDLDDVFEIGQ